ncbi:NADH-quinone oxidoreductase subunit A [bacterium]|nr:NADH-quinone oxidoreductase subunit A [bacterium]
MPATVQYSGVLLFMMGAIGFGVISLLMNRMAGGWFPSPSKLSSYECGNDPETESNVPFNFRFAVLAVLFILFEVEVVFFVPWAVNFRMLLLTTGWPAFFEMVTFFGVLALGLAYVWREGALDFEVDQ